MFVDELDNCDLQSGHLGDTLALVAEPLLVLDEEGLVVAASVAARDLIEAEPADLAPAPILDGLLAGEKDQGPVAWVHGGRTLRGRARRLADEEGATTGVVVMLEGA